MRGTLRIIIIGVVVLAVVGGATAWIVHSRHSSKATWRTGTVRKGDLASTITATGTVEPEEVVDVGAQVAGQLLQFGKDKDGKPIDYGSSVESNMLLANIDGRLYRADVDLDQAVVDSDKAGETQAEANLEQLKAKEAEAEADWKRAQTLGSSDALAPTTYDSYKANYEISKANVDLGMAAIAQAKAATSQAQANLARAKETLDYCTILSPVKGVIIDRRVNIGETVVSSLNTPSLFLIAKDLTRIQVWVSVNEADIGKIHTGQDVTFTVDAFPNRTFHGNVNKVRLNATMTQNVVTYTVEVNTDNLDGKLLPYLTANVHFLTGEAHDAMLVLNSALRWHPSPELIAPAPANAGEPPKTDEPAKGDEAPTGTPPAGQRRGRRGGAGEGGGMSQTANVWVPDGEMVRPIPVTVGLSDGTWTEIQGAGLTDGMIVVLGVETPDTAAEEAPGTSPFIPQFGRRGGAGGGGGGGGGGTGGQRGGGGAGGGEGGPRRGNSP